MIGLLRIIAAEFMEMRHEFKGVHIFLLVGLILGAALLYFPPYKWAWVGDDYVQFDYVLTFLKRPLSAIKLLNPYTLPWYYRPTQNWWFLGNRIAFGLNPAAFYWQMVLWHSLAIALVYRVLRQFRVRSFSAVLATALFAIHGHYVDVVGWNSSVAIVMAALFSLASLSAYKSYLAAKDTQKNQYLIWSFLFFLLAMVTHEEAVLLPMFFVMLTLVTGSRQQAKGTALSLANSPTIPQIATLIAMLLLTGIFSIIQFIRPNLTIALREVPTAQWWDVISPTHMGQFVRDVTLRYTLTQNWELAQGATPFLLAIVVLLLLGIWFLLGNWTIRLGLIWVGLHLSLIYVTLWQSKPELLAGRHFYQASWGLALAVGASIDLLPEVDSLQIKVGRWRVPVVMAGIVGVVTGILISHVLNAQAAQQRWVARTEIDQSVKAQMQLLLPELNKDTRVFTHRFSLTPAFFRAVTEIWYELDEPLPQPSGRFAQLQKHGRATNEFYVFDYEEGTLYNLMPELQEAAETIFLWSQEPRLDVVSPNGEVVEIDTERGKYDFAILGEKQRRFAVSLEPVEVVEGWLSLTYVMPTVPENGRLRLSIFSNVVSGAPARVCLDPLPGDTITIFEGTVTNNWLEISEPMEEFTGKRIVVRLETAVPPGGTVYWGNPRFAVD
ncbi:MAG: hypothetical protein CSB13_10070 [Chloroflexi bacterium]|nr:MAG: hypothetical protein CSB13_10070 [Chloroflexota bacterium]